MNVATTLDAVLWLLAGAALGMVYFALLHRTLRLSLSGARTAHVLPLYVLRLAVAAGAFWAIAQYGALPLLLALGGFLAARFVVQRRIGSV
jgi:F1F0 ATPase subunit 2